MALEWLRPELATARKLLSSGELGKTLAPWLSDPLLAPVRGDDASGLDAAESESWRAFWAEVREAAK